MMENQRNERQDRVLYLDCLRIFATIAVVAIHVIGMDWTARSPWSWEQMIAMVYRNSVHWPVNLFVMLSGIFFLDPDRRVSVKKLYTKNIVRLVTAFLFWGIIYAGYRLLMGREWAKVVSTFLEGRVHMWYIFLAIACYTMVPIFRQITQSRKVMEYFLCVTFFWLFFMPSVTDYLQYFSFPGTAPITNALLSWRQDSSFGFTSIYVFYFVLGLYLYKYDVPAKHRKWIWVLALLGFLGRCMLYVLHLWRTGSVDFVLNGCLFDLPVTVGIFLFGKYQLTKWNLGGWKGPIKTLSNCTFGVYLSHMLVIDVLRDWLGITTLSSAAVLSIPVLTMVVSAAGFGISWLLHQIPGVNRYVV